MTNSERSLHILLVADSKITVPPEGYGGVERVIANLAAEFVARGHSVTLIGKRGSTNYGRLRTYGWAGHANPLWRAWCKLRFHYLCLIEARRHPDVVIAYCRVDYLAALQRSGIPMLYHFENPIGDDQVAMLRARARGPLTLAALTVSHKGGDRPGSWRILPNPVDIERLTYTARPAGDYFAFLGRLTRNKGLDTAINVAERAGVHLKIAGNVSDVAEDKQFFENEIRPRLRGGISWIGEISDAQKPAFLGNARALLMPIRWPEPFGIVVAEALACGTPVLATTWGSMPELIEPGVSGFLAESEDEMVAHVARIDEIDRARCRAEAVSRFSRAAVGQLFVDEICGLSRSDPA